MTLKVNPEIFHKQSCPVVRSNMSRGHALASLTATYTDSEGEEEDENEDETDKSPQSSTSAHSNVAIPMSPLQIITSKSKVSRLVSYHDDYTMVSDEEEGAVHNEPDEGEQVEIPTDAALSDDLDIRDGIQLPPEPSGQCSAELQDKISRLYEKMQTSGLDMNYVIQQRKDFRNPSIYEKLIQFCGINEFGTNYPPDVYDPQQWGPESFYEELAKAQKTEMDRREKERKDKTKVEFVTGTARRPGSGSGAEDDLKRRKSKWDQVGSGGPKSTVTGGVQASTHPPLKPAGLLQQPSLTTTATGTKGTVISAFGSLPKKPRM